MKDYSKEKLFVRGECSKWITKAIKSRLIINITDRIICDGYSIYVIDKSFEDALVARGLFMDVFIDNGRAGDVSMLEGIKKQWDKSSKNNEIKDTGYLTKGGIYSKQTLTHVFHSDKHQVFVNEKFIKMFAGSMDDYTLYNNANVSPIEVFDGDNKIAFILPVRSAGNRNYEVVKKEK